LKRFEGINKISFSLRGLRNNALHLFRLGLIILSAGKARDIDFLQIGVVAVPRPA